MLVIVQNTKRTARREVEYSGKASDLYHHGVSEKEYELMHANERFLLRVRVGSAAAFPIRPFTRNGILHDYVSWQEAVVALAAHEGMHAQHYYDRAYTTRSGRRKPSTLQGQTYRRGSRTRVGVERVEERCEAFETYMVRRYRAEVLSAV